MFCLSQTGLNNSWITSNGIFSGDSFQTSESSWFGGAGTDAKLWAVTVGGGGGKAFLGWGVAVVVVGDEVSLLESAEFTLFVLTSGLLKESIIS